MSCACHARRTPSTIDHALSFKLMTASRLRNMVLQRVSSCTRSPKIVHMKQSLINNKEKEPREERVMWLGWKLEFHLFQWNCQFLILTKDYRALLRAPSEIAGTPNNFTNFSFCPFVKGYESVDLYEAHRSVDPYELIHGPHTNQLSKNHVTFRLLTQRSNPNRLIML